jgi:hypothetical protein
MPAQATTDLAAKETAAFGGFGMDTTVDSPHGMATELRVSAQGNLRDG